VLDAWKEALAILKSALTLLDESDAPPHIGAQLNHAICQLEKAIIAQRRRDKLPNRLPSNLT
jgi:hypothetical protein